MDGPLNSIDEFYHWVMGSLRRLYDWVLSWGKSKYGAWALFVLAIAESSFFPIPPDVLLIFLSLSLPKRSFWYVTVCTVGSVIGGALGYMIGVGFYETLGQPIITSLGLAAKFEVVGQLFQDNAFLTIVTSALTPIPYKVFTIAAGLWKINFGTFMFASLVGRGLRFLMVGTLIFFFGKPIRRLIEKYFNVLTFLVLALIIAGFIGIRYIL